MYYVYLIQSKVDNRFYVGYTADLKQRIIEHNASNNASTKYGVPWRLVYYEAYTAKELALSRERNLKDVVTRTIVSKSVLVVHRKVLSDGVPIEE